jgi:hypothetical protein
MKSEIVGESQEKQKWKFPCLGESIHIDLIVLFKQSKNGTVLLDNRDFPCGFVIGDVRSDWTMEQFRPLAKSTKVILQND